MKFLPLTFIGAALCAASQAETTALPAAPPAAPPASDAHWRVIASPYTLHYHPSEDHRHVYMLGLERQHVGGFVMGASWFRNSFGQPSAYVYAGRRFERFTPYEPLFAQLTAGVLYGYKPPYQNKVPLNRNGFSPGAVASLGWQFTPRWSAQLNFLGNSALMFQASADFH
jgi:hypothetical protein